MSINYDDPTPLRELSGEQWRELGAVYLEHLGHVSDLWDLCGGAVWYVSSRDELCVGSYVIENPTLGKLYHLIAAFS